MNRQHLRTGSVLVFESFTQTIPARQCKSLELSVTELLVTSYGLLMSDGAGHKVNMRQTTLRLGAGLAFIFLMAASAYSQQVVNIWPGVAPGSENWKQEEIKADNTPLGTVMLNVVTPTLTVYLPEKAKASGTGVIITPGGAFVALAIEHEGYKSLAGCRKKALRHSCSNTAWSKRRVKVFQRE